MVTFNKILSKLNKIAKYVHKFGIITGIKIAYTFGLLLVKESVEISLPELRFPIKLRAKTTDVSVFDQIYLYEHYNVSIGIEPKLIIDAGAYVGYTAVFFANKFPEAKIIAIEPEESNFGLLKENTSHYPNITLINSGVWNRPSFLRITDMGLGHYGFMVEEVPYPDENTVKAVTIGEVLKESGYDKIDILKMDIEGSEKEVFSKGYEGWIDKVEIIMIELHDRMKAGCSEAFLSAIGKYTFGKTIKGDNLILIKDVCY